MLLLVKAGQKHTKHSLCNLFEDLFYPFAPYGWVCVRNNEMFVIKFIQPTCKFV